MSSETTSYYLLKLRQDDDDKRSYLGRLIIIINYEVRGAPDLPLAGIMKDLTEIISIFEKLHFKVELFMNQTAAQMVAIFQRKDINYFGCVAVYMSGHGAENRFCGVDGKLLGVWQDCYPVFCNKTELKGCPKLFINDWCQIAAPESSAAASGSNPPSRPKDTVDLYVVNAASPKHTATFLSQSGSVFTQTFCKRLTDLYQSKHVDEIVKFVVQDVAGMNEKSDGNFGPPVIYTSLRHKLYLLPAGKVPAVVVSVSDGVIP